MKGKLTVFGLSATLLGCAGSYKKPESIESKMHRFKSKSAQINIVPDIQVLSNVKYKTKRGPASSAMVKDLQSEHTNRKLYFLTLLSQYGSLSKYSNAQSIPSINICPSFHSILVDHKDKFEGDKFNKSFKRKMNFNKTYSTNTFSNNEVLSSYPELMLPVSKESLHPNVAEYLTSNTNVDAQTVMQQAIDIHISKTHEELKELCDQGSSNNYYIYENLMTYIKKEGFRPSKKNMKTLLKTSIFTNIALIKSFDKEYRKIRGRSLASSTQTKETYTDAVVNRLGVHWSDNYFQTMTSNR